MDNNITEINVHVESVYDVYQALDIIHTRVMDNITSEDVEKGEKVEMILLRAMQDLGDNFGNEL